MKRKVNINRPEISSGEIEKRKDFNSVLKHSQPGTGAQPLLKKPWFLSALAVAAIAIVATAILLNRHPQPVADQPAPVMPADSGRLEDFYKAEQSKPCISPPLRGLDVPYTVFKVDAGKGATLDLDNGSQLRIPAGAFTDASGMPVKGEVELRYREFHDAADFFVSGIPMTYDSAGLKYQFESAGMMEMLAYQDGKQVNMAPGKTVGVSLASAQSGNYNLYNLDTIHNNWSCLGRDKYVVSSQKPFETPGTKEKAVQQTQAYRQLEQQKTIAQTTKETQVAALPQLPAEPVKPLKANAEKFVEDLDLSYEKFPELKPFKNVEWQVSDENKDFTMATHRMITDPKMYWSDIEIKEGPKKGENYIIALSAPSKKISFIVFPVFEGKNYEAALKEFQDRFSWYTVALDKRRTEEKKIEEEFQAKLLAIKKQEEELELQWKKEMDRQISVMTNEEKVLRIFSISRFGVYNCDNPGAYPHGVSCQAKLLNSNGAPILCYNIYLVDKRKNGLFTYYRNPVNNFSFDPASDNVLWTVEEGRLYCLRPEQFASVKSGEQEIRMTKVEQEFRTVDELRDFFGLNAKN